MPTIPVRIPDGISTKEAKALLVKALEERTDPQGVGTPKTSSEKISVNSIEHAKLFRISQTTHQKVQEVASRLIQVQFNIEQRLNAQSKSHVNTFEHLISQKVLGSRPGQREATTALRSALVKTGILMMEAPTGVGKTLVELCASVDAVRVNPDELIVIAVPTIHLMHQIEVEYGLIQEHIADAPILGYVVGRNNFVSMNKVSVILDDPENKQFIKPFESWLKSNHGDGITISTLPYQTASLYAAIPDFPSCSIDSATPKDDPGMIAYRSQFLRAAEVDILVVTHAMLAIDTKMKRMNSLKMAKESGEGSAQIKKIYDEMVQAGDAESKGYYAYLNDTLADYEPSGTLPPFQRLVVDEGHLLEQCFSRMMCDDIALYTLVRNKSISVATRKKLRSFLADIVTKGRSLNSNDQIHLVADEKLRDQIFSIFTLLSKTRKKDDELTAAIRILKSVIENLGKPGVISYIDFSPVYRFPRLRIGSKSVFMYLQYLWKSISSGAAISATLLLPSVKGEWVSSYTANLLGIPKELAREANVAAAPWLTNPVTLFVPEIVDSKGRFWLQPPSIPNGSNPDRKTYEEAKSVWLMELSIELGHVFDTAAGGTLVLLTSYEIANRIFALTKTRYSDRLVIASKDVSQVEQKSRYIELYRAGVKPVWIAVGGAWTGLNLVDENVSAANDLLLTDLVIPRLPLKMNQSITHEARVSRFGWMMEVNETMMLLKQGIGRLVRREGILCNRRIFILDSRLHLNSFHSVKICFDKLVGKYSRVIFGPIK